MCSLPPPFHQLFRRPFLPAELATEKTLECLGNVQTGGAKGLKSSVSDPENKKTRFNNLEMRMYFLEMFFLSKHAHL